jgi:oligoendopeptidase F
VSREPIPQRREVAREATWDAASIFPDDAAWETELQAIAAALPDMDRYRGRLAEGPTVLAAWLEVSESLLRRLLHVVNYASMFYNADTGDSAAVARNDRAISLLAQVAAALSFTDPELLAIGFPTLRRWLAEEPRLAIYAQYLGALERLQAHVRSAEVEELLGLATDAFITASNTHTILADADLRFAPARDDRGLEREVAQGTIDALLNSPDREARRTAWEHYADAHLATMHTMANCLAAAVKQNVFLARARHYSSALEAAVSANHIPPSVFHTLIATYRKHLPIWHRYWALRRRALGYNRLHVYDIKAPLTAKQPAVSFTQAMDWISEGMAPLGREYVEVMRRGVLEQRWVDIYPNKGKRAGAFSTGSPGTHPFILMNFNGDFDDMSTLAHELGHSMHSYYTWQTQPFVYANYSIFVAEVASNFNQALVRAHLLATHSDPDFQIAVIEEAMSNFHRYFFIMPILARFELDLHERAWRGEPLTADLLNALMTDLFREGYGNEVEIDADRAGITWAEFPTHLYANFYVYQYATGISAAHALADGVLSGAPGAVERYLTFLKAGSSDFPLEVLKAAGVDLTSSEPVEQTFGVLSRLVDRLEQLVAQPA